MAFSCFNQEEILNTVCQAEQKRDYELMAAEDAAKTESTLQRISRETAQEIIFKYPLSFNELASIIYTHFRDGKEL